MADDKKDMTGLMDFAKAQQDAGKAPPPPVGSVMEEQKIDKVDDFESLEDYSKAHPTDVPPAEPVDDFETTPPAEEPAASAASNEMSNEDAFVTTPSEQPTGLEGVNGDSSADPFPVTEQNPPTSDGMSILQQPVVTGSDPTFAPSGDDLSTLQENPETHALAAPPETPQISEMSALVAPPEPLDAVAPPPTPEKTRSKITKAPAFSESATSDFHAQTPPSDEPLEPEAPLMREPLRPAAKSPSAPKQTLDKVKQYSEQMSPGREAVPAGFPFSLLITGELAPEEKERITDILSRENMGIRELDLEPQFEAGKVLIPRISEYAGIMLVSALRSTRARIRLGPSDSIYATVDTQDSSEEDLESPEREVDAYATDAWHPAEEVRITTEDNLPGKVHHALVDVVTASAALKTLVVQAENSPEYQTLLEALQRELKYKAFRKGATAIVNFSVSLTQLHMPMHYRVMVTGSAIK